MRWKRLVWSFVLLNFLPLVYFWEILKLLDKIKFSQQFPLIPDFFMF